jgi:hypothetical protein
MQGSQCKGTQRRTRVQELRSYPGKKLPSPLSPSCKGIGSAPLQDAKFFGIFMGRMVFRPSQKWGYGNFYGRR